MASQLFHALRGLSVMDEDYDAKAACALAEALDRDDGDEDSCPRALEGDWETSGVAAKLSMRGNNREGGCTLRISSVSVSKPDPADDDGDDDGESWMECTGSWSRGAGSLVLAFQFANVRLSNPASCKEFAYFDVVRDSVERHDGLIRGCVQVEGGCSPEVVLPLGLPSADKQTSDDPSRLLTSRVLLEGRDDDEEEAEALRNAPWIFSFFTPLWQLDEDDIQ